MEQGKTSNLGRKIECRWRRFVAEKWHYLVVIVLGLVLTATLWGGVDRVPFGDDWAFHEVRLTGAAHGWQDGQILPQVDPAALGGFGYAYNIFYGPLLTYVAAILRIFVMSWPVTVNLVLTLCLMVAGVLMCYVVDKISQKKLLAALAGILYMAAPYFLLNLYQRVALGELGAMTIAPLLILGLYQLVNQEAGAVRNLVIAAAVMILTHSLSTMLFALMAVGYVLLNLKKIWNLQTVKQMLLAGVTILGVTAFFWLPMMEAKMTGYYGIFDAEYNDYHMGVTAEIINRRRPSMGQLVGVNYDLSLESGSTERNVSLGVMAVLAVVLFPMVRRRIGPPRERKMVTTLYVLGIGATLLASSVVDWNFMPGVLYMVQFSWRFLGVACLALSIVGAYVAYDLVRNIKVWPEEVLTVVLGFVMILPVSGIYQYRDERRMEPGYMPEVIVANGSAGWQVEYVPMATLCVDGLGTEDVAEDCDQRYVQERLDARGRKIEVLEGDAKISDVIQNGTHWEFDVRSDNEVKVEIPMIYYPGYEAKMDGEKLEVKPSDRLGLVEIAVPAGAEVRRVSVRYGMSGATKLGIGISCVTLAGWGVALWWKRRAKAAT